MTELAPKSVWRYFDEICRIPHPSGREEQIIDYITGFGRAHGLETITDEVGNILIRKPASRGAEHLPPVVLQSHIDMVCEKNNGTVHNFSKDPIQTVVEGDWLIAKETTMGADDGIGVAAQLAILADDSIPHGPIECLFTVEEETGLTGALNLKGGLIQGRRLVNLDSEEDGVYCIGCAGGIGTVASFDYEKSAAEENLFFFEVKVKGLLGGHSGEDIEKERGNSIKILNRFLWTLNRETPVFLKSIGGGNLHNAIPREASAVAAVGFAMKERVRILFNLFVNEIEAELPGERGLRMELESCDRASTLIDKGTTDRLLNALYACPHGVVGMSRDIEGLVETSTNLASIKMDAASGKIIVGTSQRSSVESRKHDIKNQVGSVFALAGASVQYGDGYPGWKPNMESEVKGVVERSYKRLFNESPRFEAIHAGLECGLILEKYPDMDMISIGPTIIGNHAPGEKIQISTVRKFWELLLEILSSEK